MAPELVVADAAFKSYPGGVLALRCTDWLGGARGTLSTEADARAITGGVVRDTQTVTSIWGGQVAAHQAADDTLEIDFSAIPFEAAASNGMSYYVLASLLIEGDWDPTVPDSSRNSNQWEFAYTCGLSYHGTPGNVPDSNPSFALSLPRKRPHYKVVRLGFITSVVGDEVMHVRAYNHVDGTTEILLDQLFFVPYVVSGTRLGQWRSGDFQRVGGQSGTFSTTTIEDGADGGDDNGKFTWKPVTSAELGAVGATGTEIAEDGGGDYQKKSDESDAEYMARIVTDDFYYLANTQPSPDVEASAHAYSLVGANYHESETVVEDDFSRTEGPSNGGNPGGPEGWGRSPEGYSWKILTDESGVGPPLNTLASVDGSVGVMHLGGLFANSASVRAELGLTTSVVPGAEIRAEDLILSGKFLVTSPDPWYDGDTIASIIVQFASPQSSPNNNQYYIYFDPIAATWTFETFAPTVLHGPVDISGWYAEDSWVGFKIELRRYLLRCKVWDASGAEPGTWDYEDFRPLRSSSAEYTYPYSDDTEKSHKVFASYYPMLVASHYSAIAQWETHWDDIKVEYDLGGDPGDAFQSMEQPDGGTVVGEMQVPKDAWQMVYWGARDWTELDSGSPYLAFSSKVWSESGAAELQRAEAPFWYFRSTRGGLVPMNWRSSERPGSIWRVLVGDR